jgi:hypothetical protein
MYWNRTISAYIIRFCYSIIIKNSARGGGEERCTLFFKKIGVNDFKRNEMKKKNGRAIYVENGSFEEILSFFFLSLLPERVCRIGIANTT